MRLKRESMAETVHPTRSSNARDNLAKRRKYYNVQLIFSLFLKNIIVLRRGTYRGYCKYIYASALLSILLFLFVAHLLCFWRIETRSQSICTLMEASALSECNDEHLAHSLSAYIRALNKISTLLSYYRIDCIICVILFTITYHDLV